MPVVHGTYEIERKMVRLVREGNLDYLKHMDKMAVSGHWEVER